MVTPQSCSWRILQDITPPAKDTWLNMGKWDNNRGYCFNHVGLPVFQIYIDSKRSQGLCINCTLPLLSIVEHVIRFINNLKWIRHFDKTSKTIVMNQNNFDYIVFEWIIWRHWIPCLLSQTLLWSAKPSSWICCLLWHSVILLPFIGCQSSRIFAFTHSH